MFLGCPIEIRSRRKKATEIGFLARSGYLIEEQIALQGHEALLRRSTLVVRLPKL